MNKRLTKKVREELLTKDVSEWEDWQLERMLKRRQEAMPYQLYLNCREEIEKRELEKQGLVPVYVTYKMTSCVGGEEEDPGDRWTSYTDRFETWEVIGVTSAKPTTCYHDVFNVPRDTTTVYVVIVTYSTGDTFSHTEGKIDIPEVTDDLETANEIAKNILTKQYKEYNPWEGYFERLSGVEVKKFDVTNDVMFSWKLN